MKHRIALIFGTRPEAIKLCPVVLALRDHPTLEAHVCVTAQHREMLDQVLDVFGVVPDVDLDLMQHNQRLPSLTARSMVAINCYIEECRPKMVLVQGDTTTVFCAALVAFYNQISIGHVEAGLRTGNKFSPYPEEMNRMITSRLADYHFAPTTCAAENLLREGVSKSHIFITGNTVIDALLIALARAQRTRIEVPGLPNEVLAESGHKIVLITGHRRENFGPGFRSICLAVAVLAARFPHVTFIYPVHLNPNVREPIYAALGDLPNVRLIEPLSYLAFVFLMNRATIILTDSGGIQEEASSLGKPVLVMRDTTERPEGIKAGTARLVGTDCDTIVSNVSKLLTDPQAYAAMSHAVNPYGDGKSSERIAGLCKQILGASEAAQ